MNALTVKEIDFLEKMYEGSYYTITGAGGDLSKWIKEYTKLLSENNIGIPKKWYTFKGRMLNNIYLLSGNNKYKNDLTFLAFPLDDLDISKLAMFKIKMGDRWFNDIVDNNVRREVECI